MKSVNRAGLWRWTGGFCLAILFSGVPLNGVLAANGVPAAALATNVEPDLLDPQRAFQLSARRTSIKNVELQFKIAEGYYMYRGKFKFAVEPDTSAKLGKAILSKGKMKQDATFGAVEIYRNSVRILLSVTSIGGGYAQPFAAPLRIKVMSQGCADAGVCFPPLHQSVTLMPTSFNMVLPDVAANAKSLAGGVNSSQGNIQPSLVDSLKKFK